MTKTTVPSAPRSVEAFLESFLRTRARIVAACESLPPSRRDDPFVGRWSARDLVAHLIGWDRTNVEAVRDFLAGRLPAFYARYDSDWASFNAELIATYEVDDWDALLAGLRESQRAFVASLRGVADAELGRDYGVRWQGRRVTLAGLLRAALRDETEHLEQLRAFVWSSRGR